MSLVRKAWRRYSSDGLSGLSRNGYYFLRRRFQIPVRGAINWARLRASGEYAALANPLKPIAVDPNQITYKSTADFSKRRDIGRVVGGDWDRGRRAFSETVRFNAIEKRFVEGCTWEETGIIDYHRRKMEEYDGAFQHDGCLSLKDVRVRYRAIDEMYESMKTNGYDESKALHRYDHPYVHIGRDGELLHASVGNHRVAVAKVLDLESIPVFIVVRHEEWQRRREEVVSGDGDVSTDEHPDLKGLV